MSHIVPRHYKFISISNQHCLSRLSSKWLRAPHHHCCSCRPSDNCPWRPLLAHCSTIFLNTEIRMKKKTKIIWSDNCPKRPPPASTVDVLKPRVECAVCTDSSPISLWSQRTLFTVHSKVCRLYSCRIPWIVNSLCKRGIVWLLVSCSVQKLLQHYIYSGKWVYWWVLSSTCHASLCRAARTCCMGRKSLSRGGHSSRVNCLENKKITNYAKRILFKARKKKELSCCRMESQLPRQTNLQLMKMEIQIHIAWHENNHSNFKMVNGESATSDKYLRRPLQTPDVFTSRW